jgi:chromosome partitioning protein
MAHVISVQNVKGGCGKTTTAIHLAAALTDMGYAVALADGDPQMSALSWLERRGEELAPIEGHDFTELDLDHLKALKKRKDVDYVIVDGRAAVRGAPLADFIKVSDVILVPIVGLPMDIEVSVDFLEKLWEFRKVEKGEAQVAVVLNKTKSIGRIADRVESLSETLDVDIAGYIPDRSALQNPIEFGETAFDHPRVDNEAAREPFVELAKYVIAITG